MPNYLLERIESATKGTCKQENLNTDPFYHRKILLAQDLRENVFGKIFFLAYILGGSPFPTPLQIAPSFENKSKVVKFRKWDSLTQSIT